MLCVFVCFGTGSAGSLASPVACPPVRPSRFLCTSFFPSFFLVCRLVPTVDYIPVSILLHPFQDFVTV